MVLSNFLEAGREVPLADDSPRLRFVACRLERTRAAISRVTVELDGPSAGQRTQTLAEGSTCPGGDLRLAAQAMLDALTKVTDGALQVDLIGVKPMRAFDTNIVVVAVVAHVHGESRKLVGAAIVDDDAISGAALAALHAMNRVVAPLVGSAALSPVVQAASAPRVPPTAAFSPLSGSDADGGSRLPASGPSGATSIVGALSGKRIGAFL